MATENKTPINEEENEKAASRDPQDIQLGNIYDTGNKEAGEAEAWQHAYDASTPSYELNLDAGIAPKLGENAKEEEE